MGSGTVKGRPRELCGLAGVFGVVVPVAGQVILPIWTFPGTRATGAQIGAYIRAHHAALEVVMVLNSVGVTLWLVFGCGVWLRLRRAAGPDSVLPMCLAVGFGGFITLLLSGFTAFDVLIYRAPDFANAKLLYDLAFGLLAMSGLPTALALGAYSLGVHTYPCLPRRTARLACAAATAHVALLASFVVTSGFFSLQGAVIAVIPALLFAWIFDTAVAMLRHPEPGRT
ncbi:MAG: hypothetical protein M3O28_05470 [Actinomycetota bacterium]|nr:hypothetical protein [Actinomycetota bacterium]